MTQIVAFIALFRFLRYRLTSIKRSIRKIMDVGGFIFSTYLALSAFFIVGDAYVIDKRTPSKWANNEEIEIFREYLRIPTVSSPIADYKPAVAFLQRQAINLSLPWTIYYPSDEEAPVFVMTWKGTQPELPSIMLNSHMDVVPVFEEYWTHPPFGAEMDENGDIYARGAQDMKCVGTQYLAAIRALNRQGIYQLKRTVYVVFVPDEEISGARGMASFVNTTTFKAMNVGFMLDEGSAQQNVDGYLNVNYGQRTARSGEFIVKGHSGHGSRYFEDTPGVKMTKLLAKLNEFREEEIRKLTELNYSYGNVTTINLTILKGGVQYNVVPAEMRATFDIRVSVNADLNELERKLRQWCDEVGENITINYMNKGEKEKLTKVDDSNPFWFAFKSTVDKLGLQVVPGIALGSSDARFLRKLNIPALGFSPLFNTIPKLHDHNEYINADTYLKGIDIYKEIVISVANV